MSRTEDEGDHRGAGKEDVVVKHADGSEYLPEVQNVYDFKPWDGHLAVKPRNKGRTRGGIIIPDTAKDNGHLFFCDVFAVGPGCVRVKVGDTVLVHGSAEVRKVRWNLMNDKDDFILVKEDGILGTI